MKEFVVFVEPEISSFQFKALRTSSTRASLSWKVGYLACLSPHHETYTLANLLAYLLSPFLFSHCCIFVNFYLSSGGGGLSHD